ncbi:hypothetical protein [Treponema pedis]|uniref:hypothetical protein n=1 Tax=Treponema pedis TaxID=409322 RepID=UPI003D1B4E19
MKKKIFFISLISILCISSGYTKQKTDYELISGNLKLKVFAATGHFCLYSLSPRGKGLYMPLYDDRSLGRDNKFYVLHNKKIYELKKKIGKPVKIEQGDDFINIIFYFTDKFYVTQKLSFTAQTYGTSGPLLKIETAIENTCGTYADVALKAIFDTNLGENRRIPLYTDLRTGIFRETVLEPKFEKDSAVISANSDAACLFLINHTDASQVENIYIANWDRLQSVGWIPPIVQGRSFSTKYFHNDSALLFVWPEAHLQNNETLTVSMFIGYYDYLRRNEKPKEEAVTEVQETVKVLPEPVQPVPEQMSSQELKDYTYIKTLLEKIAEVEADPDKVSDEYIDDLTKQADSAINDIQE